MMAVIAGSLSLKSASKELDRIREKSLEAFVEKLKESEGDNLLRVVLFGSVARGDSRTDSDIDVFVLVKEGEHDDLGARIVNLAVDVDLEEGECRAHLSPFILTWKDYAEGRKIGEPVFIFIEEEGITLYDSEQ
jgi:predicted nucleotidyltransferase